jgi:ribosomal-protein-alanine N-acetyltransferase
MLEVNFQPFPTLETERLTLREITRDDVNEIFSLRSDKELMRYISRPLAVTMEDALKWMQVVFDLLENNNGITWGISLKETPLVIGTIGLWRIDKPHYRAELGYMLQTAHQQKGITSEVLAAVVDYGFKEMKLHSIEAKASPNNAASLKVLDKAGFVREAYFKEDYYFNGQFLDTVVYSLLAPKE